MPEPSTTGRAASRLTALATALVAVVLAAVGAQPAHAETPVLGESALTAEQIVDWYEGVGIESRSPTSVARLAEILGPDGGTAAEAA